MTIEQDVYTSNPIIGSFLSNRGLTSKDVEYLINPNAKHQHNPFLLKGVGRWIDLLHAVKGKTIAIDPDYDADGVLSGTLARVALSLFGFGDAYLYSPKTIDGYGMTRNSVDAILEAQPNTEVIITTDNGSNAHDGILYAKEKGITVLVTDHHLAEELPFADAVVNPNGHGDHTYPFRHISGTAVIYKVLSAYAHKYITDVTIHNDFQSLILLVGISTISDVMPMLNENRYFVTESVKMLDYFVQGYSVERVLSYNDTPLHQYYRGVDLLVTTLNRSGKLKYGINADTFGFLIGPLLNSPRRMTGESELAFRLFQSKRADILDPDATLVSDLLYQMNEIRKTHVGELSNALFDYIEACGDSPQNHMVFNARMGGGVAGLLSNSFTSKFQLPSVAFGVADVVQHVSSESESLINVDLSDRSVLSGSARAPDNYDLHGILSEIDRDYPRLMDSWGGHAQAAGIKIKAHNFEAFRSVFVDKVKKLIDDAISSRDVSDSEYSLALDGEYVLTTKAYEELVSHGYTVPKTCDTINTHDNTSVFSNNELWSAVRFFSSLEPFGQSFPKPSFSVVVAMKDVSNVFYMGTEKQHAKLMLSNGLCVIHWRGADLFRQENEATSVNKGDASLDNRVFIITGTLGINEYAGNESLQLIAENIQSVEEAGCMEA